MQDEDRLWMRQPERFDVSFMTTWVGAAARCVRVRRHANAACVGCSRIPGRPSKINRFKPNYRVYYIILYITIKRKLKTRSTFLLEVRVRLRKCGFHSMPFCCEIQTYSRERNNKLELSNEPRSCASSIKISHPLKYFFLAAKVCKVLIRPITRVYFGSNRFWSTNWLARKFGWVWLTVKILFWPLKMPSQNSHKMFQVIRLRTTTTQVTQCYKTPFNFYRIGFYRSRHVWS